MKKPNRALASSFILHGKIQTTVSKAKAVKPEIEKLAGLAKKNSLSSRRRLQSFVQSPAVVNKLFDRMKSSSRSSGFIRLIHTGIRRGDSTRLSRLEWVDSVPSNKTHLTRSAHKPK